MENDQNKKESKGKRILKKALRRNSKSSSSSQNDSSIGVTRSKSFESKKLSIEINDSAPLPTADWNTKNAEAKLPQPESKGKSLKLRDAADEPKVRKSVDIQEKHNIFHEHEAITDLNDPNFKRPSNLDSNIDYRSEPSSSKKNLKRKVEDESGAGTSGASTGNSDNDADDKDSKDKKKKNRCAVCRKKVGLTGFECRCGGLFCAVHRYSDKHECSFDYRELGAQEIRRNNPVVVSQKIHKI